MDSPGRELAAGCDVWPKAEMEGGVVVGHRPLAGGGESRRPKAVCNPGSSAQFQGHPHW